MYNASNVSEGEALPEKKGKLLALNTERQTLDLPLKPLSSHRHAGKDVGNRADFLLTNLLELLTELPAAVSDMAKVSLRCTANAHAKNDFGWERDVVHTGEIPVLLSFTWFLRIWNGICSKSKSSKNVAPKN